MFSDMCVSLAEETAPGAAFQPTGNQTNPEGICSGPADGGVAQLGEHLPCTQGVSGSNPLISTMWAHSSAG
jgi:hypothetical protein